MNIDKVGQMKIDNLLDPSSFFVFLVSFVEQLE